MWFLETDFGAMVMTMADLWASDEHKERSYSSMRPGRNHPLWMLIDGARSITLTNQGRGKGKSRDRA